MAERRKQDAAISTVVHRIARHRLSAKWVLFTEALLPRLLWPVSIGFVFVAISWFGVFHLMPPLASWLLLAILALAGLYSLKGFGSLHWPSDQQADRRLEKQNGLAHQAVSMLSDRPAVDNPQARALWEAHRQRLARKIKRLEAGNPEPGISTFDPYGLRVLPVLAAVVAFGFSYSNQGGRLSDAFRIRADDPSKVELRADAWVTPPAYTGKAPIFLTAGSLPDAALVIPENSELTVRLSGGGYHEGEITYQTASSKTPAPLIPEKTGATKGNSPKPTEENRTYLLKLVSDGTLAVNGNSWQFSILKDKQPEITFEKDPAQAVSGALEISYTANDDYGIETARAIIEPADPEDAAHPLYPPPEYRLDLPKRNSRDVSGLTSRNLTEHPLSGKRIKITLVAKDNAGQEGRSRSKEIILPARSFNKLLAAAVAEERQVFSLDISKLDWAIKLNQALFLRPDEAFESLTHFLLLQSAGARMKLAHNEESLKDTADYLWEIALGIEDGNLSLAERRLRDAQQALADALERKAGDEEIRQLMQDLRDALNQYMQALAEQLRNNPDTSDRQQDMANILRQQDLERMLDQIENLAQSGSREQAMNLLSEMQRMLNNLQTAQPRGGQPQNNEMRKQIDKLGELLQNQKSLMDQTFELEQALRDRLQRGDPGEREEDGDPSDQSQKPNGSSLDNLTAEELKDALKKLREQQKGLGEQLGQLQEGLRKQGVKPLPGFSEAGREMGQAADALGKGQGGPAVGSQGRAMEALRQGASELMQQLSQNGRGQGQALSQPGQQGYDPLGRPLKSNGPDFGENVKVPEEIDIQRAREILETIRRKLGENISPEIERLYLERLLDIK